MAASKPAQPKKRRVFNTWVNNPVMEDYALRYAPTSFRRWTEFAVASSALGGIAYLADFAIGGSITLSYGFTNALLGILVVAAVIFLTGIPIAYYSAKYNIDMDLLTRGAGFGYYGSTLTSLVYASFTFIYFSLEGSVMSQALNVYFGMPLPIAYLVASLIIIPLVIYGMTFLTKLQVWTQPVWLLLLVLPLIVILSRDPHAFVQWTHFAGASKSGAGFDPLLFGAAAGVTLSLIAQIGEQVDYLRFMPDKTPKNASKWWWAVMLAGPGWVILGAAKQLGGSMLASYIAPVVGNTVADEPIQMYIHALKLWIPGTAMALTIATFFVLLSQIKINVTNAYSGSLSWSNFFSRVFHAHPGRVVWLLLNVGIALTLMEMGVFGFLGSILGFYSNVAVAWIGAVVADLVVNKPLKLSPSYIEFKRGYLYNFNPVGFGSMVIASAVSIAAFFGAFGAFMAAFSPFLSLVLAFVLSPILAVLTRGKYYIARVPSESAPDARTPDGEVIRRTEDITCVTCEYDYEAMDMVECPYFDGPVCSLCCSLEKDCHDMCKTGKADEPVLVELDV